MEKIFIFNKNLLTKGNKKLYIVVCMGIHNTNKKTLFY